MLRSLIIAQGVVHGGLLPHARDECDLLGPAKYALLQTQSANSGIWCGQIKPPISRELFSTPVGNQTNDVALQKQHEAQCTSTGLRAVFGGNTMTMTAGELSTQSGRITPRIEHRSRRFRGPEQVVITGIHSADLMYVGAF